MENIGELIKAFSKRQEVESIALGGSRATGMNDAHSDYDLYIYLNDELAAHEREDILKDYCSYMEINNTFWEAEDDCKLKNGIVIELIYRKLDDFEKELDFVVTQGNSYTGYTTCMWHNLLSCKILYDESGKLTNLKKIYEIPYPAKLKENIIEINLKLLDGYIPSYSYQIEKALSRHDLVSVNHRIAAFMASYFDILFALNEKPHPGEKRLVQLCKEQCDKLPEHFEENIERLTSSQVKKEETMNIVNEMIKELKIIL